MIVGNFFFFFSKIPKDRPMGDNAMSFYPNQQKKKRKERDIVST